MSSAGNKSKLGFGVSGPLGEAWFSEKKLYALIAQAVEGGIRRFDTAGFYGDAEARLGRILKHFPDVEVSTKVGTQRASFGRLSKDFTAAAIKAEVELSLVNLRRNRLDLLYLHGPHRVQAENAIATIEKLKKDGKIKAVGICSTGPTLEPIVKSGAFDAVMAPFNLVNRCNLNTFKIATDQGMETAAIVPLAQGIFDPKFFKIRGPSDIWRISRAVFKNSNGIKSAKSLRNALENVDGWTPAQAALGYVLAQSCIDLAFTTTTKQQHLDESIFVSDHHLPPDAVAQLTLDVQGIAA